MRFPEHLWCVVLLAAAVASLPVAYGDFPIDAIAGGDVSGVIIADSSQPATNINFDHVRPEQLTDCFPVGDCIKCKTNDRGFDKKGLLGYCTSTGYKQENACTMHVDNNAKGESNTGAGQEAEEGQVEEVRVFRSCEPSASTGPGDDVVQFEALMMVTAVASSYVVWTRKQQAYQRLSSIVNA